MFKTVVYKISCAVQTLLYMLCFTWYFELSDPEVIKQSLFSCSTQLSMKFQLLLKSKMLNNKNMSCFQILKCIFMPTNVKMTTIVGILTFIVVGILTFMSMNKFVVS